VRNEYVYAMHRYGWIPRGTEVRRILHLIGETS
jgi:hypothetical protein